MFLEEVYNLSTSLKEREDILRNNHQLSKIITDKYTLDRMEEYISYFSGIVASIIDVFFCTDIRKLSRENPLGIEEKLKDSGVVNKFVDKRIRYFFNEQQIQTLEEDFWVPYDPSTNAQLINEGLPSVLGLRPQTHRLSSPGHDPILGLYYGVRDILHNTFTTIDNNGDLLTLKRNVTDGENTPSLVKAIWIQLGHLLSDLSSVDESGVGLPFPFLGQLGRLKGRSPFNEMTYNRLVKNMQLKGYNFNHFITEGVPGLFIESTNRILFFMYQQYKGRTFKESLPVMNAKLDKMLFRSYLIAMSFNAGKIIWTNGNVFAFNPDLWIKSLRYGITEYKRLVCNTIEKERYSFVSDYYKTNISQINKEIKELEKFYSNRWQV